jgi:hypothetical protein
MPVDSMLVSAAVLLMFAMFAGVLAWGESQTRLTAITHSQKRRRN